jgi:DNA-binding CsgD family transcriptional regulator
VASKFTSWLQFLDHSFTGHSPENALSHEGIEKYTKINSVNIPLIGNIAPLIYLLDYTTGEYLVISDFLRPMLGYQREDFLKNGISFTQENYDPRHFAVFNKKIFPESLAMLKKIPPKEHSEYIFSFNFRFKTRTGQDVELLQRNCFVKSDANHQPLLSFGIVSDMTHFKNENRVTQIVEKLVSPGSFYGPTEIFSKKLYYLNEEDQLLTKREKQLLPYLADGLCSKEIANKMFISEHTVINHRRNMMEKTGSRNMTQLISFALGNGLL